MKKRVYQKYGGKGWVQYGHLQLQHYTVSQAESNTSITVCIKKKLRIRKGNIELEKET